ncbi:MAG TPA: PIG-L family deacetylase [Chloroflexi bacterium]|jgi:LmbE family N-acetylglucosaminyl deacetylase|nr:PIG-L family deacetylase [Chloroflexota bacterium]
MQPSLTRRIYLSPHLDDAVLSCGGTIYAQAQRGERVLVVTAFAGSPANHDLTPFTRELWERWGAADDPVAARRAEDLAALTRLGAQALHLSHLDCVYRQHPATGAPLYPTVEDIFAEVHPAEASLAGALCKELGHLLAAPVRPTVYAPLAAGHHVDHQIVRQMAMRLVDAGVTVLFYEDWPYAEDDETIARALDDGGRCWRRQTLPLSAEALVAKGDAVAYYASQISTFWSSTEEMRRALRAHAETAGGTGLGEGYWTVSPPPEASPTIERRP